MSFVKSTLIFEYRLWVKLSRSCLPCQLFSGLFIPSLLLFSLLLSLLLTSSSSGKMSVSFSPRLRRDLASSWCRRNSLRYWEGMLGMMISSIIFSSSVQCRFQSREEEEHLCFESLRSTSLRLVIVTLDFFLGKQFGVGKPPHQLLLRWVPIIWVQNFLLLLKLCTVRTIALSWSSLSGLQLVDILCIRLVCFQLADNFPA